MSLVMMSALGLGTLWYTTKDLFNQPVQKKETGHIVAERMMSTGTYGDISEIGDIVHEPGVVIGEKIGQDLTGMPKRWLVLQNGAVYQTYDMSTQYVK